MKMLFICRKVDNMIKTSNLEKRIKNLPIRKKLSNSFLILSIVGIIVSIVVTTFLIKTNMDYKYAINNYGFSQGIVGKLGIKFNEQTVLLRDLISADQTDKVEEYKEKLLDNVEKSMDLFEEVGNNSKGEREKESYDKLYNLTMNFRKARQEIIDLGGENRDDEATDMLNKEINPLSEAISDNIDEMLQINIDDCNKLVRKLAILEILALIVSIAGIVFFIVMTSVLSRGITKIIADPILKMKEAAHMLAEGNLNIDIEVESKDEIGDLAVSFKEMINNLKGYIEEIDNILGTIARGDLGSKTSNNFKGNFIQIKESLDNILKSLNSTFYEIRDAASQVAGGSEQVSQTAQSLSEGAIYQASAVEELKISLEKINKNVKNNLNNAKETDNIVKNLGDSIIESGSEMDKMVLAMNDIEKSSKGIKEIIVTIENIAEQTNLLSLNAAIEAARSGHTGNGFAVVAEEVKKLAEESSKAVKETVDLIENSIQSAEKGKEVADVMSAHLNSIVKNTKEATELVSSIAVASEDQSLSIEDIKSGVEQISDVVQSNSAVAQESAAASEELTAQTETLNSMVERFRLAEN